MWSDLLEKLKSPSPTTIKLTAAAAGGAALVTLGVYLLRRPQTDASWLLKGKGLNEIVPCEVRDLLTGEQVKDRKVELSGCEKGFFAFSHHVEGVHIGMVFRCRGVPWSASSLRAAVQALQRRHHALRSVIRTDKNKVQYFDPVYPEVRVIIEEGRVDDESYKEPYHRECGHPLQEGEAAWMVMEVIPTGCANAECNYDLILSLEHCIMDARSMNAVAHELFRLLCDPQGCADLATPLPVLPGVSVFAKRRIGCRARVLFDTLAFVLNLMKPHRAAKGFVVSRPDPSQKLLKMENFRKSWSHDRHFTLDKSETSRLRKVARQHGTTVGGVVHYAVGAAAARVFIKDGADASAPRHSFMTTVCDMRKRVTPPVPSNQLGMFLGMPPGVRCEPHPEDEGLESMNLFWRESCRLSQHLRESAVQKRALPGLVFFDFILDMMPKKAFPIKETAELETTDDQTLGISSWGLMDETDEYYEGPAGTIAVKDMYPGFRFKGDARHVQALVSTTSGRMTVLLGGMVGPAVPPGRIDALAAEVERIVRLALR